MRKLHAFEQVSLDGFFVDDKGDMSWAHQRDANDAEWNEFVSGNASSGGVLLFGRKTYDLMVQYWPTPMAAKQQPAVAAGMNKTQKIVVSRSLQHPTWENTTVIKDDLAGHVKHLKKTEGPDITILGSGSIVAQLAAEGLIDEYTFVVNPLALGRGRTLFEGVTKPIAMKQTKSRAFKNGNVVLTYHVQ